MALCKYCGNRIDDDSVFCSSCGRRLADIAPSAQHPPPPEPEHQSTAAAGQKSPTRYAIPAAIAAFIAVMLVINSVSNHSSGSVNKAVSPTPPAVSISIPPELFNVKPAIELPESPPEPADKADDDEENEDEEDLYENIGDSVIAVLSAITGRPEYALGVFEPLIGVTDVNGNGLTEILAVYETENNGTTEVQMSEVEYDVWIADSQTQHRVMNGVLFYEVGGSSGVVHLLQDADGALYVMLEQNMPTGEYFHTIYDFYKFSDDETTLDFFSAWETDGYYDTENGGIAEANYYTYYSDRVTISAAEFKQHFDNFTTIYSLDILSGEYNWDNTLSFDWAWKAFQAS